MTAPPSLEDRLFRATDRAISRDEGEEFLAVVARHLSERCKRVFDVVLDSPGGSFAHSGLRGFLHSRRESGTDGPLDCTWAGVVAATNETVDGRIGYGAFLFPFIGGIRVAPTHGDPLGALYLDDSREASEPTPPNASKRFWYVFLGFEGGEVIFDDLGWQEDEARDWDYVATPRHLLEGPP